MNEWEFTPSVVTIARREEAWACWANLRNHARMEPGVDRIEARVQAVGAHTGMTVGIE
jgi:hypothetical protein